MCCEAVTLIGVAAAVRCHIDAERRRDWQAPLRSEHQLARRRARLFANDLEADLAGVLVICSSWSSAL